MHQVWPKETATFSLGNKVSFFPTLTASASPLPFLNGRGTVFFLQPSLATYTAPWNTSSDHCLDCQLCTSALCTPWKSTFLLKIINGHRLRRQHSSSAAASICSHARKNSPPVPDQKIVSHLIHQRFEKGNTNISGRHNSNSIFRVWRRLSSMKVFDYVLPRSLTLLRLPAKCSLKALISFLSPSWCGAYDPGPVPSTTSPLGDPPGQQPRAWTSWAQHKLRIQDLREHRPACFHYFSSSLLGPPTESHRQIHVPPHRHKLKTAGKYSKQIIFITQFIPGEEKGGEEGRNKPILFLSFLD